MALQQIDAKAVVESLERGVPDQERVLEYTARSRIEGEPLREMLAHLDDVRMGVSKIRFINGAYGEGKSHTLALLRRLALDRRFIVSSFSLEAHGVRFDQFHRVLGKMIEVLSCPHEDAAPGTLTVLEQVIKSWAEGTEDVGEALDSMGLGVASPDLKAGISTYSRILLEKEPRNIGGLDRLDALRHWFVPESTGLRAADRRGIGVLNNITARNARQVIESLAQFFREADYSGWVVLVDEQEIVPTLMTPRQRDRCNENLRLLLDAANQSKPYKGMYYVFASAPEFFTDQDRGVNAYPALRDRITNAVLVLKPLDEAEMYEVAEKVMGILRLAEPGARYEEVVSDVHLRGLIHRLEERFAEVRYKTRGFVQSLIAFARRRAANPEIDIDDCIEDVLGTIFTSINDQITSARTQRP